MASFSSPLADKGRDTRNRLERCWSVTLNWELFPTVLREVSMEFIIPLFAFLILRILCTLIFYALSMTVR